MKALWYTVLRGVNLQSGEVVVVGKRQKLSNESQTPLFVGSGCGHSTCSGGGVCGVCSGGEFSDLVQWVCSRDTMSVCMGSRHFAKDPRDYFHSQQVNATDQKAGTK
ncbi:hypothetical protein Tco_0888826 [Tanacetum coccineum]